MFNCIATRDEDVRLSEIGSADCSATSYGSEIVDYFVVSTVEVRWASGLGGWTSATALNCVGSRV